MNTTLIVFVVIYLLGTLALGVWAGTRIKNSTDFAIAGRSLPLVMVITTTFATWFGSETVLGIPAKFVNSGLGGVVEDPFGAGTCLILVGMISAAWNSMLGSSRHGSFAIVSTSKPKFGVVAFLAPCATVKSAVAKAGVLAFCSGCANGKSVKPGPMA